MEQDGAAVVLNIGNQAPGQLEAQELEEAAFQALEQNLQRGGFAFCTYLPTLLIIDLLFLFE
jgi:hypothetical protein